MNNSNKIFIDGQDFTGSVEGVDDFAVTFQEDNETKTISVSISNALTFRGDAFRYLESKFFASPVFVDSDAAIKIVIPQFDHEYDLYIRADAMDYCPEICEISGSLTERKPELAILSKIPEEKQGKVDVQYCLNVDFMQVIMYAIILSFRISLQILNISLGGFLFNGAVDALQEAEDLLIGCNREKAAYNIFEYIQGCASEAGLSFQSSILTTAPYKDTYYVDSNSSINRLSCIEFLNLVKQPFNAEYKIKNGVLYFERVDFFTQIQTRFVNVDNVYNEGRSDAPPCYRYTAKQRNAYGRYEYSSDNIDSNANEMLDLTNDIVDFNNPFDPYKRGDLKVTIPFSPARYSNDRDSNSTINALRPPDQLLLSTSISQFPKLVIGQNVAGILRPQSRPRGIDGRDDFTYQMWFDAQLDVPELYQNFWFISNPNETNVLPFELDSFTFAATCEEMDTVKREGIDLIIETRLGDARAESISINYTNGTITLEGVQII